MPISAREAVAACIAGSAFFRGLSEATLEALASIGRPRAFARGETLFLEGDRGGSMLLLASGEVRLGKAGPDGSETVIKIVGPGEVFAEVVLFETDRYPVTATAVAAGIAHAFPRSEIQRLLSREDFRNDFIAMLMRKQRYLAARIHDLSSSDAESRLVSLLRERVGAGGPEPFSKKEAAAAIGATPETLSRVLRRLAAKDVLTWKGREIRWGAAARSYGPMT